MTSHQERVLRIIVILTAIGLGAGLGVAIVPIRDDPSASLTAVLIVIGLVLGGGLIWMTWTAPKGPSLPKGAPTTQAACPHPNPPCAACLRDAAW